MIVARSLTGFFCDDIRQEVHGKASYIGVYSGNMLVSSFPITLPRLCVYIQLQTPSTRPYGTDIELLLYRDGELLAEGQLPATPNGFDPTEEASDQAGAPEVHRHVAQFIFSPLNLDGPCVIRARAKVDGEELGGLALEVARRESDVE